MPVASWKVIALPLVVVAFLLSGCENTGQDQIGPKTGIGAALGAAGGGLLGAALGGSPAGIAAGVLLGGLGGGFLGNQLDNQDKQMAARASPRMTSHRAPTT